MYVRRHMLELHEADGIESLGSVKWQLTLCLVAVYIICYFSLWKGISTSGKVSRRVNLGAPVAGAAFSSGCYVMLILWLMNIAINIWLNKAKKNNDIP